MQKEKKKSHHIIAYEKLKRKEKRIVLFRFPFSGFSVWAPYFFSSFLSLAGGLVGWIVGRSVRALIG